MKLVRHIYWLGFVLITSSSFGQEGFSWNDFLQLIDQEHPVGQQLRLLQQKQDAYLMKANGSFDPKLTAWYDQKSFDGKNYYSDIYGELKIPTRLGPELKVAYEHSVGDFLNNRENLPDAGLYQGGIILALGNGLMFDERRYDFQEATIQSDMMGFKQLTLLNKTLFGGLKQFVNWSISVEKYQLYKAFLTIADQRLENIRLGFEVGDIPAVDTIEALANVNSRAQDTTKALLEVARAYQMIENFSWREGEPVAMLSGPFDVGLMPPNPWSAQVTFLNQNRATFFKSNPELNFLAFEKRQVEIDLKLNKEYLKPTLNLRFNPLVELNNQSGLSYQIDDYKLGIDFTYPILNRKYRGARTILEASSGEIEVDRKMIRREVENQIDQLYISLENLQNQFDLLSRNINNLEKLVLVEREKFAIGESSIFLINSRENKWIEARLKLIALKKELLSTQLEILNLAMHLPELI